jgi:hypothetical protein
MRKIRESEVYLFLLNPTFVVHELPFLEKYKNLKTAFFLNVKMLLVWGVILAFISFVFSMLEVSSPFSILSQRFRSLKELPKLNVFLFAVVLAPLIEELTFRGFLVFKRFMVGLSAGAFTYSFGQVLLHPYLSRYFVVVTAFVVLCLTLVVLKEDRLKISLITKRRLLYFSCTLFALVHISNYDVSNVSVGVTLLLLFAVIPQGVTGICLSFVRLKNGIAWSIFYHSIFNLICVTPLLLRA